MDLRVNTFGLYIKANRENCGLEEPVQVVYIVSMASLLKENINYKHERTTWGLGFVISYDNNNVVRVGHNGSCPGYVSGFPSNAPADNIVEELTFERDEKDQVKTFRINSLYRNKIK